MCWCAAGVGIYRIEPIRKMMRFPSSLWFLLQSGKSCIRIRRSEWGRLLWYHKSLCSSYTCRISRKCLSPILDQIIPIFLLVQKLYELTSLMTSFSSYNSCHLQSHPEEFIGLLILLRWRISRLCLSREKMWWVFAYCWCDRSWEACNGKPRCMGRIWSLKSRSSLCKRPMLS